MWSWAAPLLKAKRDELEAATAGPAAASVAAQETTSLFDTILNGVQALRGDNDGNGQIAAAVMQMAQANQERMMDLMDPSKQMATIEAMIARFAPKQDNSMALIVDLLREDLKAARAEMRELRAAAAQPRPDLISQLIENAPKLKEVAAFLGFGGKGSASGTDWGQVISQSVDKFADNVPIIVEAWKWNKATGQQQNGTQQQPWRPGVVTDQPAQVAAPSTATTAGPTGTATPPPAAAENATEEERIAAAKKKMAFAESKYGALIKAVSAHLVDMFRAGMTGYDFRDWFIDRQGRNNWVAVRDEVGAETLTQLAMAHPLLRAALQPPEKLYGFLMECFTNPGEENADRLTPATGPTDDDDDLKGATEAA
jgi:hypothetical protein